MAWKFFLGDSADLGYLMRTEKEIRALYNSLKPLKGVMVIQESMINMLEWVLKEGNEEEQNFVFSVLKDVAEKAEQMKRK